jgi:hypothetical protein
MINNFLARDAQFTNSPNFFSHGFYEFISMFVYLFLDGRFYRDEFLSLTSGNFLTNLQLELGWLDRHEESTQGVWLEDSWERVGF